jgi:hypothetical protein
MDHQQNKKKRLYLFAKEILSEASGRAACQVPVSAKRTSDRPYRSGLSFQYISIITILLIKSIFLTH